MQKIIDIYSSLYKATGGHIENKKSFYFVWKWEQKHGKRIIKDIYTEIKINNTIIKQTSIDEAIRMLGVYLSPSLQWNKQIEILEDKLRKSIAKLINMNIHSLLTYVFYNAYLLKSVYFRRGIMFITEKQEQKFHLIYKATVLKKLGLSSKFPWQVLYARKSALGIGIMKLTSFIETLGLKLYIRYK